MAKNIDTWLTLNIAIEGFLLECHARSLSKHTILQYKTTLERFYHQIGDKFVNDITLSEITKFLNAYNYMKPKSVLNLHIALSAFWSWLQRQGYVEENIIHRIPRPKPQQVAINPFTESEIKLLFSALGRKAERNRAILLLLLDTGIRASELINLKKSDIDLKTKHIRIWGKGNKERIIPISAKTASALFKIISQSDTEYPLGITRTRLTHLLNCIGARAGVANVHPHRFRHTFAVLYLRNGGDVFSLQSILGHSSMEMVKKYLTLAQVDVDQAHQKASPVENMRL